MRTSLIEVLEGPAHLVDCVRADTLDIPVGPRSFLHAGPPLTLDQASPALVSALIAGLLLENQASTPEEALTLVGQGRVEISSCHSHGGVGALAGLVAPSTPVFVVERADGRRTFSPISEGNVSAVRFGQFDAPTLAHLRWLGEVAQPVLSMALTEEPVDVVSLLARSIRRGDEGHNRCTAGALDLLRLLAPRIARRAPDQATAAAVLAEIGGNPQFTLPIGMAAAKGAADTLHECGPPGIVTAACGNGTEFGIRVSGTGATWFTGPGVLGSFTALGEFSVSDANPIIGDSPIMEVVGLGAHALDCAPELVHRLGMDEMASRDVVAEMREVCAAESTQYLLPSAAFRGSPTGISVERVAATGTSPAFTIGYLHRRLGRGRVGIGIGRIPIELARRAQDRLAASVSGRRAEARP